MAFLSTLISIERSPSLDATHDPMQRRLSPYRASLRESSFPATTDVAETTAVTRTG
jgi:hypothetical protein